MIKKIIETAKQHRAASITFAVIIIFAITAGVFLIVSSIQNRESEQQRQEFAEQTITDNNYRAELTKILLENSENITVDDMLNMFPGAINMDEYKIDKVLYDGENWAVTQVYSLKAEDYFEPPALMLLWKKSDRYVPKLVGREFSEEELNKLGASQQVKDILLYADKYIDQSIEHGTEQSNSAFEQVPIAYFLPMEKPLVYRIEYAMENNNPQTFRLVIYADFGHRTVALNDLYAAGQNPGFYEIVWKSYDRTIDYVNPFGGQ